MYVLILMQGARVLFTISIRTLALTSWIYLKMCHFELTLDSRDEALLVLITFHRRWQGFTWEFWNSYFENSVWKYGVFQTHFWWQCDMAHQALSLWWNVKKIRYSISIVLWDDYTAKRDLVCDCESVWSMLSIEVFPTRVRVHVL